MISWPVTRQIIDTDPEEGNRYLAWRTDSIEWAKERWGDSLACVAEHVDEQFGHLHIMAAPSLRPDQRLAIADVHPGHSAALEAAEAGLWRKSEQEAYIAAMVCLQDALLSEGWCSQQPCTIWYEAGKANAARTCATVASVGMLCVWKSAC